MDYKHAASGLTSSPGRCPNRAFCQTASRARRAAPRRAARSCRRRFPPICTTSLRPRRSAAAPSDSASRPARSQGSLGMAPPTRRRSPCSVRFAEARDVRLRRWRNALQVDLQRGADEHVAGIEAGGLVKARLERSEPSAPVKKMSAAPRCSGPSRPRSRSTRRIQGLLEYLAQCQSVS